jgi:DNA-directed RNA polymerases I, II, and III subunit RPABC2
MFISCFLGLWYSFKIHDGLNHFTLKKTKMINLSEDNLIGPPKLTRFERARIVGARALQISLGAPILAPIPEDVIDTIDIAVIELNEKVLPMTIRRKLPEGTYQDIPLFDLLQQRVIS